MGMIVHVLRNGLGDCTNGGVSSRFDRLVITNVDGPFEPAADMPGVVLDQHVRGCLRLVPQDLFKRRWVMAGGNFAEASDSRFSDACERLLCHRFYGAVSIHDRVED